MTLYEKTCYGPWENSVSYSNHTFQVKLFPIRPFRIAAYSVIVLSILCGLFAILEIFPLCQPFAYNWDKTIPGGHCVNGAKAFYAVVSTNLITDLLIVILPMPMTWRLQLPTTRKLALTSIFGIGLLYVPIHLINGHLHIDTDCSVHRSGSVSSLLCVSLHSQEAKQKISLTIPAK